MRPRRFSTGCMHRKRLSTLLAVAGTAAFAAVAPAAVDSPTPHERATKTVQVGDDYFTPTSLKIARKGKVQWRWASTNLNTHNVELTNKHPDGVDPDDYKSVSGSTGVDFKRRFKVPGRYGFVCTFHRSVMRLELKVKK